MSVGLLPALAAALLATAPVHARDTRSAPHDVYVRGAAAFDHAEYGRAIELLRPLLEPEVLLDTEGEVVAAHRMLGIAYLFQKQPDKARGEFHKLLELRPDYRFDPLIDAQPIVDAFNQVLKEEEDEISRIEKLQHQHDEDLKTHLRLHPPATPATTVVVRYERLSYAVNFIPFGTGQFQNGQRRKGWLFLGVETALAAISVGAFATNFGLYGLEPHRKCLVMQTTSADGQPAACPIDQIDHSQEDTSRDLLRVQLISGGLFFAAAIWGVIDAVRHYQRDRLLPEPAAPAPAGLSVGLTSNGLGAVFRF
ncbi:MAG TPA: tetratricopeptide repeat protein [Polyangia bacterium]|nr:tetratricopeptide repeat protein [Polyangia bacterium]